MVDDVISWDSLTKVKEVRVKPNVVAKPKSKAKVKTPSNLSPIKTRSTRKGKVQTKSSTEAVVPCSEDEVNPRSLNFQENAELENCDKLEDIAASIQSVEVSGIVADSSVFVPDLIRSIVTQICGA